MSVTLCEVERIQESGSVLRRDLTIWLLSTITRQQLRLSVCEWWCLTDLARPQGGTRWKGVITDNKVTWLILPVVICLSQRLSHACLSINKFIRWNCVQLIISVMIYLMVPYYMDTRSNSRANTCVKSRLLVGRDVFIRFKPNAVAILVQLVTHSNLSNRMALCWR